MRHFSFILGTNVCLNQIFRVFLVGGFNRKTFGFPSSLTYWTEIRNWNSRIVPNLFNLIKIVSGRLHIITLIYYLFGTNYCFQKTESDFKIYKYCTVYKKFLKYFLICLNLVRLSPTYSDLFQLVSTTFNLYLLLSILFTIYF